MNHPQKLLEMLTEVETLAAYMEQATTHKAAWIKKVHPTHRLSAVNLIQYAALRSIDLRRLQHELSISAISSSTHAEAYSLHNVCNIRNLLQALLHRPLTENKAQPDMKKGRHLLRTHTEALFGGAAYSNQTHIMVTLPTEAATDAKMVRRMAESGMRVARINTAHDDRSVWEKMVRNIRSAEKKTNSRIFIYMDLAGPKLRTITGRTSKGKDLQLKPGDRLVVRKRKAVVPNDSCPSVRLEPGRLFKDVRQNHAIWFDDGKIGGEICEVHADYFVVDIRHTEPGGSKLRNGKGINLPDTDLNLPALTTTDQKNLPFICRYADMLGYSFVRKPEDIATLQEALQLLRRPDIGIILKIENAEAFHHLPALLLQAMQMEKVGVMIARGDLAVELGMLRLAEVQEEIMWMCEAAHIPVIWATQVLESLIKKGSATRAEISDAVNAVRAECAMLNKGPFIEKGIQQLIEIDKVMTGHEDKKRSYLRPLSIAAAFLHQA